MTLPSWGENGMNAFQAVGAIRASAAAALADEDEKEAKRLFDTAAVFKSALRRSQTSTDGMANTEEAEQTDEGCDAWISGAYCDGDARREGQIALYVPVQPAHRRRQVGLFVIDGDHDVEDRGADRRGHIGVDPGRDHQFGAIFRSVAQHLHNSDPQISPPQPGIHARGRAQTWARSRGSPATITR